MQNRLILPVILAVLAAGTISAKAGLGWTFDECKTALEDKSRGTKVL